MTLPRPLYWFIHHEIILEEANEPIENRIAFIKSDKKQAQHAVRLAALQPVKHPELLPSDWVKADAGWVKANADCEQANGDCVKANAARVKAHANWLKALTDWLKAHANCEQALANCEQAHANWLKAHADWVKALVDNLPALVARYLAEYPENAKLFDHKTGHLIFP
jgi:hypothetical protein